MSIDLLRSCEFDWVTRLNDIWGDWPDEDFFVHQNALNELLGDVDEMSSDRPSPIGRVMTGKAGSGKTHLLRHLRRAVQERSGFFFLVDGTDIRDFWSTLSLGLSVSLLRGHQPGWTQVQALCYFLSRGLFATDEEAREGFLLQDATRIEQHVGAVCRQTGFPQCPGVVMRPIVRALFYLNSGDPELMEQATMWLQGVPLDQPTADALRLAPATVDPLNLLRVITRLCAPFGPVVIAFDQIDALITQHHLQEQRPGEAESESARRAREILQGMGAGLMAIPDQTCRTLVTLSCLDDNWSILQRHMGNAAGARFRTETVALTTPPDPDRPMKILAPRIHSAAERTGVNPNPVLDLFKGPFSDQFAARTPREILQAADRYRRDCLRQNQLIRADPQPPPSEPQPKPPPQTDLSRLNEQFARDLTTVEVSKAVGDEGEDAAGKGLALVLPLLRYELPLPNDVDLTVDCNFAGGRNYPTLHARIRLTFRNEGDREFHLCLRVLEKTHHSAFRARLNSAMIESGIDRALPYRCLILFRHQPPNFNGAATRAMLQTFTDRHGQWLPLPEQTLRVIKVLLQWKSNPPPGFEDWLQTAQPLSSAEGLQQVVRLLLEAVPQSTVRPSTKHETTVTTPPRPRAPVPEPPSVSPRTPSDHAPEVRMVLGYRDGHAPQAEEISMPVAELSRHVVIRAGSGGGKTVLIKRLVENAALCGVSSVVLDPGNDLAQMANDWPENPTGWLPGDQTRRDDFRRHCDVVIYTPGRNSGRPLHLPFLPDFSSVADSPDDLQSAVEMAVDRLAATISPGKSPQARHKRGILAQAFRLMAQQKRPARLATLAEMFEASPEDLDPGVPRASKLIQEMAGSLRSYLAEKPAADSSTHLLNWSELFGLSTGRPRVSVINFTGLSGLEEQQAFVAMLAESLFGWMRRHPASGTTGLSGLLVCDEAKDFLPSQTSPPSKKPLMRLAAQARKYGVGLLVATQNPKDLDYNAVAQFSTQYFGRANAPQVIEFIQKLLADKGATSANPAQLKRGQFYLCAEAIGSKPQKITCPLCLTAHPDGRPLTEAEILQLAAR